jgi:hypothetical protein
VHRTRGAVNDAAGIGVERKAPRRRATGRNARSGNAAIGVEACRIVDDISHAVH